MKKIKKREKAFGGFSDIVDVLFKPKITRALPGYPNNYIYFRGVEGATGYKCYWKSVEANVYNDVTSNGTFENPSLNLNRFEHYSHAYGRYEIGAYKDTEDLVLMSDSMGCPW